MDGTIIVITYFIICVSFVVAILHKQHSCSWLLHAAVWMSDSNKAANFFLLFRLSIKVLDCCRDSVASLEAGLCYLSKLEQRQVNSCSRSVYLFSSAASRKPHSPDLQLTCCLSNVLVRLKSRNVDPLHLSMFCRGHFYILPAISLYTPLILWN